MCLDISIVMWFRSGWAGEDNKQPVQLQAFFCIPLVPAVR